MKWSTERVSRKDRRCEGGCGSRIRVGDRYKHLVVTPNDSDIGNTQWMRMAECWACAVRRGAA